MTDCIFCKIIKGDIPSTNVFRDEQVTAFQDTNPRAPVHLLIVPNEHIESIRNIGPEQAGLLNKLISVANQLAQDTGIDQTGYRLVINTGPDAGQSVFHLHLHLLGGRKIPMRFD